MSDPMKHFEALARDARDEISPVGDVSTRTIAAIRAPREPWYANPLIVCATAYGFVCAVAIPAALYWYSTVAADPLSDFLTLAIDIAP